MRCIFSSLLILDFSKTQRASVFIHAWDEGSRAARLRVLAIAKCESALNSALCMVSIACASVAVSSQLRFSSWRRGGSSHDWHYLDRDSDRNRGRAHRHVQQPGAAASALRLGLVRYRCAAEAAA